MRLLIIVIVFTLLSNNYCQNYPSVNSLYKFKFGKHISVLDSLEYPTLKTGELEDGTKYYVFMLDKQTGTYIIFRFSNFRKEYVYGIQITGHNSEINLVDDIRLGDSKDKVFNILGLPSDSNSVESLSLTHYTFKNRNYSIELDTNNLLYSFAVIGYDGLLEKYDWPANWLDYEPSSIAIENSKINIAVENMDSNSVSVNNLDNKTIYFLETNPFRPRVKYTGELRLISKETYNALYGWLKEVSKEQYLDNFKNEIQVLEDSVSYWIPIQETLIQDLNKESLNGEKPLDLFITIYGIKNDSLMMIVNEFMIL